MNIRSEITTHDSACFIACTNSRWQRLFAMVNGNDVVYKWFDYQKAKGHFIVGYVIMPDHFSRKICWNNYHHL